jgi:two-component sensor histidine kinase
MLENSNILIVDDNPENLRLLIELLERASFRVRPALSGEIALKAVEISAPDLILLDIRMPGIDGFETCRRLKAQETTRNIPVIFISAMTDLKEKLGAFRVGGVDYVMKPFQEEEVLARVRTHLQLSKMADLKREIAERERVEIALKASLAEKEVLISEIHHRVKNNLAAIIGLLDLQKKGLAEEAAINSFHDLSNRILSMALVHERLYRSENMARIDFREYVNDLTSHLLYSYGAHSRIRCRVEATGVKMGLETAVPIGLIINELATNAIKYAFPKGEPGPGADGCEILITAHSDEDTFTLVVADNGVGFPREIDWRFCSSLGLRLVRMLGEHQLGGQLQLDRAEGTRFVLRLPARRGKEHHGR